MRDSLLAGGLKPAAEGPLDMVIAFRCDPLRQAWWNLWKPTGDALGPILGEPNASTPFSPADDRVVRLEMHLCPTSGLNRVTQIGLWWRRITRRVIALTSPCSQKPLTAGETGTSRDGAVARTCVRDGHGQADR